MPQPQQCPVCGQSFVDLDGHMTSAHGVDPAPPAGVPAKKPKKDPDTQGPSSKTQA